MIMPLSIANNRIRESSSGSLVGGNFKGNNKNSLPTAVIGKSSSSIFKKDKYEDQNILKTNNMNSDL